MEPGRLSAAMIAPRSIATEVRRRLSPDLLQTVKPYQVGDFEADGWNVARRNKTTVRMRLPKTHEIIFEDRVWATFAKLQFTTMSTGREISLPMGSTQGQNSFNVFAADDEVALLVTSRSASELRHYQFKDEVESISRLREATIREVRADFPAHKIKFILATNNCILSQQTSDRLDSADIVHMDEDVVDYYLDLADHLGKAARFQLLGNLFAGTKIPGLEPRVAAIQGTMGGHKYYSFAIEPDRLLKLGFVLHRNKANTALMPTYQRLIKRSRLRGVSKFVDEGGFFPNSVIVNIDSGRRPLRFEPVGKTDGPTRIGTLHLPQTYRAAYIIDGQHRLYGYADSNRAETDLIPVVAFVDLPRSEQVRIFMQINENQHAVPKNLRNTLNADLLWDSSDLREQAKALRLRIAQHLGEDRRSPLFGRVIIGENKRTPTRCITIDAISRGLDRGNLLGVYTKSTAENLGTLYRGSNESTFKFASDFVAEYLWYLRSKLNRQWQLGSSDGGFVFINSGVESLIRVLSDIVDHLTIEPTLDISSLQPDELLQGCIYYIDPLIDHLSSLDPDDAAEYRRQYGSGGATKYWRRLQQAVQAYRPDFDPHGLEDFLANEARVHDQESTERLRGIEMFLKNDVRSRLEDVFGSNWFREGVPRKVRESASKLATDKNLDAASDDEEVEPWDCLYLVDYAAILTRDHAVWVDHFEKRYTRPGDENKKGGWKARVSWLSQLNEIRNDLAHGRSIDETAHDFLTMVYTWLVSDHDRSDSC